MRPSRKAAYWETSVSTGLPSRSMVLVSGRRVVSARKGRPSTWPSRMTRKSRLIGKRGLVTLVGLENIGVARSTRSLSGAVGRPRQPLEFVTATSRSRVRTGATVLLFGAPPSASLADARASVR